MKNITILGSTGSIGINTLYIIANNTNDFNVYALSAYKNIELLYQQCLIFKPLYAVIHNEYLANKLSQNLKKVNCITTVLYGVNGLIKVSIANEVHVVMAAIVGIAGLIPIYYALKSDKTILLANKEILVTAGNIIMEEVKRNNRTIIPVDSEHSGIFQCLRHLKPYQYNKSISKIILTASGGPFLKTQFENLKYITPDQACKHPNWKMGRKISVDSSTMVNKAFEIIETYWLFNIDYKKIEVIIHPESIIHALVEYTNGSVIAQMSINDMKIPIQYALYYPKTHSIDLPSINYFKTSFNFENLDQERFKIIPIIFKLLKNKNYSCAIVLNAANEILVEAFLEGKIAYLKIMIYLEYTCNTYHFDNPKTIDDVIIIDQEVRKIVKRLLHNDKTHL